MDSDFNRAFLNLLIRSEIESISFDYLSCIIFNLKKREKEFLILGKIQFDEI